MKIVLPGERPQSWNQIYSGQHWAKRAAEARRVHELVVSQGLQIDECEEPAGPFDITITAFFKGRQLDADNISSKFYIDGLKGWLIKDDSREYVRSVTTRSMVDKDNPRMEIEITETVGVDVYAALHSIGAGPDFVALDSPNRTLAKKYEELLSDDREAA